jgi:hypothetical protein
MAKVVHISLKDIGKIIRKETRDTEGPTEGEKWKRRRLRNNSG